MVITNFFRRHSRFVDLLMSIPERDKLIEKMQATVNGENGWMQRKKQYCEKCEEICEEKDDGV
ncbi:MAG: hypothetical protein BBJ57_02430 [Desulfobacterales bacterium PC51MH44]|nr:MAG: hypothetical protein BBJ57_02430 [Desulfobacterales bacterium PC51MH44]